MEKLTRPLKEIERRLSMISNYDKISKGPYWTEWVNTVFSWGIIGLDNIDVYDALKDKSVKLKKIMAKDLTEVKPLLERELGPDLKGCIAGIRAPEQYSLDDFWKIVKIITENLNPNAEILHQVIHHNKETVELLLLLIT